MPNITTNNAITYTNDIEGKITECWLVNEESIFLNFASWRGENYSLAIASQVA